MTSPAPATPQVITDRSPNRSVRMPPGSRPNAMPPVKAAERSPSWVCDMCRSASRNGPTTPGTAWIAAVEARRAVARTRTTVGRPARPVRGATADLKPTSNGTCGSQRGHVVARQVKPFAEHLGGVGAEGPARVVDLAWRARQLGHHVLHPDRAQLAIRDLGQVISRLEVRVFENVADVVDRSYSRAGIVEDGEHVGGVASAYPFREDRVDRLVVCRSGRVVDESWIVDQLRSANRPARALEHALSAARHGKPAAIATPVGVSR